VPGGIQQDPPPVGPGLIVGDRGSEFDQALLGGCKVVDGEVEVELLAARGLGQGGAS
jgi:hypothetical protein